MDRYLKALCRIFGAILLICVLATIRYSDFFGIHLVGVDGPSITAVRTLVMFWTIVTALSAAWMIKSGRAQIWLSAPSAVLLLLVMAVSDQHLVTATATEAGKGYLLFLIGTVVLFSFTGPYVNGREKKTNPALNA